MARIDRKALLNFPQDVKLDGGKYICEVVALEEKTAQTGRVYLSVKAKVVEGPEQKNGTDPAGKFLFFNLMYTVEGDKPGTLAMFNGRLNGFFNSFGDRIDDELDTSDQDDCDQVVGQEFGIEFTYKADKKTGEENFEPKHFFEPGEPLE